jgi:hypothetical protein
VAQLARDREGPHLTFQLLIYPAVGMSGRGQSMELFATGYFFERKALDWLYAQYLDDPKMASNPMASPVLAHDLSRLPPAFVVTAEFDILRDDGEYYVQRLRAGEVPAHLHRYEKTIHGFVSMADAIEAGREAIDECAAKLRDAFDASRTAPALYQIAFENEFVRIVRVSLAKGEIVPGYVSAGNEIVRVDVSSGKERGTVRYCASLPPESARSRCDAYLDEIRVELKGRPKCDVMPLDAVKVDRERYRVVLENDRVRVVRLAFQGHEKGLMVTHPPRVLVTLTEVSVKLLFSDGRTDARGAPAGVAGWLDTETLQTENVSGEPLEVILVEPKSL